MYVAYEWVIHILFEIWMIIINHYNLRPKHYNLKHSIYGDVSRSICIITKPGQKVFLIVSILYWRLMLSLTEMWYSSNVSTVENLHKLKTTDSKKIRMNYDSIICRLYISTTKTTPRWKRPEKVQNILYRWGNVLEKVSWYEKNFRLRYHFLKKIVFVKMP